MQTRQYVGFCKRFLALLLDWMIVSIISTLPWFIIFALFGKDDFGAIHLFLVILVFLIIIAVDWLYYALMESSRQQATLGKQAMGIIVTDLNGNRISFKRATIRYFARNFTSFLTLGVGLLITIFGHKALHDRIADTLVIRKSKVSAIAIIATVLAASLYWFLVIIGNLSNLIDLQTNFVQSQGRNRLSNINQAQINYYQKNNKFAENLFELSIREKDDYYSYSTNISTTPKMNNQRDPEREMVVSAAKANLPDFPSYMGGVFTENNRIAGDIICEIKVATKAFPEEPYRFKDGLRCPNGYSEVRANQNI